LNPFTEQFLIEGRELVEQAVNDLLALETHPGEAAHLDGVFRAVHTLKGAAGMRRKTRWRRPVPAPAR
jgi:two-component system chemotaxis sensor kinase CheA